MKKNTNFFERLYQIIDYYNIKSINSFAIDYLNYKSSEKINRLKKGNTNPSYEIICDIANKFEFIDINWLLLGTGNMLKDNANPKQDNKIIDQISFNYLLERYEKLAIENGRLNAELNILRQSEKRSNKFDEKNNNTAYRARKANKNQ
jgi:hypothetical protein